MDELEDGDLVEAERDWIHPPCPRCGGEGIMFVPYYPENWRPCSYCGGYPTGY